MDVWVPDSRLDRVDDRRIDEAWVTSLWRRRGARLVRVAIDGSLPCDDRGRHLRDEPVLGRFDPEAHFLVGAVAGAPYFTTLGDDDGPTRPLRGLAQTLSDTERDIATTALALTNWHRVAPHCGACGGPTHVRNGGHARHCPACERDRFPRTDPAVIVAVVDDADRLLLGHQVTWPEGRVSLLAGFVEAGESLEQAVRREVHEEAGVRLGAIRYHGSQPHPFPRSLMLGFIARAVTTEVTVDGVEIEWGEFFSRDDVYARLVDGTISLPTQSSIAALLVRLWLAGELPAPQ